MRTEIVVSKCLLDQALTVIERALHGDRDDIVAKGCHLRFLNVAHLSFRIQDDDACVRDAMECLRDGAAGIA